MVQSLQLAFEGNVDISFHAAATHAVASSENLLNVSAVTTASQAVS
jgi:hypothetical protein